MDSFALNPVVQGSPNCGDSITCGLFEKARRNDISIELMQKIGNVIGYLA